MSETKKSEFRRRGYRNIKQLREKNIVKSLILEYENVLSHVKDDVTNMGADQSVVKPMSNNNSLVKQRIEKFNQIENEFKKTPRSISTYGDANKPNNAYQRSKSVDSFRKNNNRNSPKVTLKIGVQNKAIKYSNNKTENNMQNSNKCSKTISPVLISAPNKSDQELWEKKQEKSSCVEKVTEDKFEKPVINEKKEDECFSIEENSNVDEVFDEIENQLQDASNTIFEMTENKGEPVFISSVCNFTISREKDSGTSVINNISDSYCDDTEDIENIDIYLRERNSISNDSENEFGEIMGHELKDVDFIEAYNQPGHELLMTTVHSVKQRYIVDGDEAEENETSLTVTTSPDDDKEQLKIETHKHDNYYNFLNGVENKLYFSKEELERLIPDDDYEHHTPFITPNSEIGKYLQVENVPEENILERKEINKNYVITTLLSSNSETEECNNLAEENILETKQIRVKNNYPETIKSETTIYDSFQNPRIAKVRSITKREDFSKDNLLMDHHEVTKTLECKSKIKYIIEELVETEKKYIDHLESVLEDYMPYFRSNNLAPRNIIKTLFGNIKDIYKLTTKLYRTLKESSNYDAIAKTFLKYKPLFEMYPIYFKNKPKADQYLLGEFKEIISIRERELNDQLGLASHLLTPIQRLGKYILFLEQINKELNKNGVSSEFVLSALRLVKKEMSTGNDHIAIDSIKNLPIRLMKQGSFLMREKFKVHKPKKYEAMVFFFEKVIVFTVVHPKNSELFYYKDDIMLNEMGIVTYDDQPLWIHLKRFRSGNTKDSEEQNRYIIEAKKEKDKKMWTDEIEKRLWDQLIQCRERQMLLRNCAKKKHLFEEIPKQTRKTDAGQRSLPEEKVKRKSTFYLTT